MAILQYQEATSGLRQRDYHNELFQEMVRPTSEWVRDFRAREGRLPKPEEISNHTTKKAWLVSLGIYDASIPWVRELGCPDNEFIVWLHSSDWALYHQS